jgi:hypothetical protein
LQVFLHGAKWRKAGLLCAFCLAADLRYVTFCAMRVPLTVRTVAEVIGMPGAVRLLQAPGKNESVYVPQQRIKPDHRLASILQPHELTALQRTFGGELLPYPSARGMRRRRAAERKAHAIQQDITAGLTTSEIAAKHDVSESYVRRIRSKGTTSSGWRRPLKNET